MGTGSLVAILILSSGQGMGHEKVLVCRVNHETQGKNTWGQKLETVLVRKEIGRDSSPFTEEDQQISNDST